MRFALLGFLFFGWVASSPAQHLQYYHWSLEEGLSNSQVTDLLQDRHGRIWIATAHGLNCFDGINFRVYRYDPFDSTSIGANYIENIFAGADNRIWAVLSVGGLSVLDPQTERFTHHTGGTDEFRRAQNYVHDLCWDAEGRVWAGTPLGLQLVHPDRTLYEPVCQNAPDLGPLQIARVQNGPSGKLWLSDERGLFLFEPSTRHLQPIASCSGDLSAGYAFFPHQVLPDDQGRHWVATARAGIWRYLEAGDCLQSVRIENDSSPAICLLLQQLPDGKILAATAEQGFLIFDEKAELFRPLPGGNMPLLRVATDPVNGAVWAIDAERRLILLNADGSLQIEPLPPSCRSSPISDLLVDREHNLWLSTLDDGLWLLQRSAPLFPRLTFPEGPEQPVSSLHNTALLIDRDGQLWLGSPGGLWRYSFQDGRSDYYCPRKKGARHLASSYLTALLQDRDGRIWAATGFGLSVYDRAGNWLRDYFHDPEDPHSLPSSQIRHLIEDEAGRIWIATARGISIYHPGSGRFSSFWNREGEPAVLGGNNVRCIVQDGQDQFWVGFISNGLSRLTYFPEQDSIACRHFYFRDAHRHNGQLMTVNDLFVDQEQQLWIGSFSRGLLRYDREADSLVYGQQNSTPIPNVAGILQDGNGHLWLSANDGLWRFDPQSGEERHYTVRQGLQSNQFNIGAKALGPDGRIYLGGIAGINAFRPEQVGHSPEVLPPLISEFRTNGKARCFACSEGDQPALQLEHREDFIEFRFLSPGYPDGSQVQYAYRLVGFDPDWVYCGQQRSVSYSNLPGGAYRFQVRAGNLEGTWQPAVAELEFYVNPPFWNTFWFYLLVAGSVTAMVAGLYRLRWQIRERRIREIDLMREKAASDFHDELGHRLTKISLFTEAIFSLQPTLDQKVWDHLGKIRANSTELYHSMRDFIWAMNPRKDNFFELAVLLKDFGDELYENTGIQFTATGIGEEQRQIWLQMEWKRNLVLIFKEAMHNSLKHSQAEQVRLHFRLQRNQVEIRLHDDGQGFDLPDARQGYGLGNMQRRSDRLGGRLQIETAPSRGTTVIFTGELPKTKRL